MNDNTLGFGEKTAYSVGALGKNMAYMMSASYTLYYYQDVLGVSAVAMGVILLVARIIDAFYDPVIGVFVAKTRSRWGRFLPWLLTGTLINALMLFLLFSAPPSLDGSGLIAYAAVFYTLFSMTYTMMDIPYWSMIPAFTKGGKEREKLTSSARSFAGIGSVVIMSFTLVTVTAIGKLVKGSSASVKVIERTGFRYFALIVSAILIVLMLITCSVAREKSTVDMKRATVREMFRALFQNDQAITMVVVIILVNMATYIMSNLLIYFFKYDIGGEGWKGNYTIYNTFVGIVNIFTMMILFRFLRRFFSMRGVFHIAIISAVIGYSSLLYCSIMGVKSVYLYLVPGFFTMTAVGLMNVLNTVFLANTVDYGQLKNGRRDESVIFSMQTFVIKLASGVAALLASFGLQIFGISKMGKEGENPAKLSDGSLMGLRLTITVIPIIVILLSCLIYRKKYILSDERMEEITAELNKKTEENNMIL